ncbi:ATP synthase subunit H [Cooperia oncophora]
MAPVAKIRAFSCLTFFISGIIQTMIIMTAVCCHLFWIMIYLHQLNPLIGPQINVKTIRWISLKWGDSPTPVPLGQ